MKKRAAAAELVNHPAFRRIAEAIPKGERDNLAAIAGWFHAAEVDPAVRRHPQYGPLLVALKEAQQEAAFAHQFAEVVHSPEIRRLAGDKLDHYLENPQAAYDAAMALYSSDPQTYRSEPIQKALGLLAETKHAGYWGPGATDDDASATDPVEQAVAEWSAPAQPDTKAQLAAALDLAQTNPDEYRSAAHQAKLAALANGQPAPPPKSRLDAEWDAAMGLMKTNWREYASPAHQQKLFDLAAARQEQAAASTPATPSAPPASSTPSQGGE